MTLHLVSLLIGKYKQQKLLSDKNQCIENF